MRCGKFMMVERQRIESVDAIIMTDGADRVIHASKRLQWGLLSGVINRRIKKEMRRRLKTSGQINYRSGSALAPAPVSSIMTLSS